MKLVCRSVWSLGTTDSSSVCQQDMFAARRGFTEISEQSAPSYLFFYQALQAKQDEETVLVILHCRKSPIQASTQGS